MRETLAQKKWGPALLPAPTAPSEGYAGVRNLVDGTLRLTDPLSILAHQLRRRFLSNDSPLRGARPVYQTARPEGSLVLQPIRPDRSQNRPTSAALLGETALASRFAHRDSEEPREPRRARGSFLFRRLFPAGPASAPKSLRIACRRRSDLWSPAAPSCPCGPFSEAGTAVPITQAPCTSPPSRGSEK
jgi:hypothetical protein